MFVDGVMQFFFDITETVDDDMTLLLGKMKGYRAVYAVALCLSVVIQSFFLTGPMIVEQIISIFISSPDALKNIENQRDLLILLCVAMILFVFVIFFVQYVVHTLCKNSV